MPIRLTVEQNGKAIINRPLEGNADTRADLEAVISRVEVYIKAEGLNWAGDCTVKVRPVDASEVAA